MINLVVLAGRVSRNIEIRRGETNTVGYFTIAVNRGKEKTDFIPITCFNKTVEFVEKYISTGDLISVEGKVQMDSYVKDDEKRYVMSIIATNISFLQKKKASQDEEEKIDENSI